MPRIDRSLTILPLAPGGPEPYLDCDFRVKQPGILRIRIYRPGEEPREMGDGQHAVICCRDGAVVVATLRATGEAGAKQSRPSRSAAGRP